MNNQEKDLVEVVGTSAVRDGQSADAAQQLIPNFKDHDSEWRYRRLVAEIPYAIILHCEGVIVFVNPAAVRMLRASCEDDLIGRTMLSLIHPDSRPFVAERIQQTLHEHQTTDLREECFLRLDGTAFYADVTGSYVTWNQRPAAQVICRDVTIRKKALQAIRENEARFRELAEGVNAIFWLAKVDETILYISPVYEEIFQQSCDALYQDPNAFLERVHPLDRERIAKSIPRTSADLYDHSYRIIQNDGSMRWIQTRSYPIRDETGEVYRVAGISEDITERKHISTLLEGRNKVLELLTKSASVDEILSFLVRFLRDAFPDMHCGVLFIDDSLRRIRLMEAGFPEAYSQFLQQTNFQGFRGWNRVVKKGERLIIEDLLAETTPQSAWQKTIQDAGFQSCWLEPIKESSGASLGAFVIHYKHRKVPTSLEIETVQVTAQQAAIAINKRRTEQTLLESEARFRTITEHTNDVHLILDKRGYCQYISPAVEKVLGFPPVYFLGEKTEKFVHPDDWERVVLMIGEAVSEPGVTKEFSNWRAYHKDGRELWVDGRCTALLDVVGVEGIVLNCRDITARRQAEIELRKLSQAVEQSPSSVLICDADGAIQYINPSFSALSGFTAEEVEGKDVRRLDSGYTPRHVYEDMWETLKRGESWRGELHNRRSDGAIFLGFARITPIKEREHVTHYVWVIEDLSIRKEYEEKLARQAHFDPLTELPNRVLFFDRLSQVVSRARRDGDKVALLVVNLDHFKDVNNTLGHQFGDQLLCAVARRLRESVHESHTVARMTGDGFAVALDEVDIPDVEVVINEILHVFSQPFEIDGHEVFSTVSVGAAIFPSDGDDARTLHRHAEAAMFRAKQKGRCTACFFAFEMNQKAQERIQLESRLHRAIERDELMLVYQPIIEAEQTHIVGVEALVRWENRELGLMVPDRFIPLAENNGLIVPIGAWVLQQACQQAMEWSARLPLRIAVNVSAQQFKSPSFYGEIVKALDESGLAPDRLEIEVTERVLMDDAPQIHHTFLRLRELGVRLSIDDFGTGYSSLSYLKRFPFDVLKIDRSFVRDIPKDKDNALLVESLISFAHRIGLEVLAEGVETQEQLDFLKRSWCQLIQGYYLGRPMGVEKFEAWLDTHLQSASSRGTAIELKTEM